MQGYYLKRFWGIPSPLELVSPLSNRNIKFWGSLPPFLRAHCLERTYF